MGLAFGGWKFCPACWQPYWDVGVDVEVDGGLGLSICPKSCLGDWPMALLQLTNDWVCGNTLDGTGGGRFSTSLVNCPPITGAPFGEPDTRLRLSLSDEEFKLAASKLLFASVELPLEIPLPSVVTVIIPELAALFWLTLLLCAVVVRCRLRWPFRMKNLSHTWH
jgi:hypothetical protein